MKTKMKFRYRLAIAVLLFILGAVIKGPYRSSNNLIAPQCNDEKIVLLATEIAGEWANNYINSNISTLNKDPNAVILYQLSQFLVEPEKELSYSKDTGVRTCRGNLIMKRKPNLNLEQIKLAEFLQYDENTKIPLISVSYISKIYKKNGEINYYVEFVKQ